MIRSSIEKKIDLLQQVLDQSKEVTVSSHNNPTFRQWKDQVERVLIKIFGSDSIEFKQFQKLRFFYKPQHIHKVGSDYSKQHRECFERDFERLVNSLRTYINELQQEEEEEKELTSKSVVNSCQMKQVFISHASSDKDIVEELVEILEVIGLSSEQIFCTSLPGYDIGLGENFLDSIKEKLADNTLTLFLLTHNFYSSPVCLCEMGAVWVQTKQHIPILIPPFDFKNIEGVIPLTQGFKINDPLKLNSFKEQIEETFSISPTASSASWERKRNRILERINKQIKDTETS